MHLHAIASSCLSSHLLGLPHSHTHTHTHNTKKRRDSDSLVCGEREGVLRGSSCGTAAEDWRQDRRQERQEERRQGRRGERQEGERQEDENKKTRTRERLPTSQQHRTGQQSNKPPRAISAPRRSLARTYIGTHIDTYIGTHVDRHTHLSSASGSLLFGFLGRQNPHSCSCMPHVNASTAIHSVYDCLLGCRMQLVPETLVRLLVRLLVYRC